MKSTVSTYIKYDRRLNFDSHCESDDEVGLNPAHKIMDSHCTQIEADSAYAKLAIFREIFGELAPLAVAFQFDRSHVYYLGTNIYAWFYITALGANGNEELDDIRRYYIAAADALRADPKSAFLSLKKDSIYNWAHSYDTDNLLWRGQRIKRSTLKTKMDSVRVWVSSWPAEE